VAEQDWVVIGSGVRGSKILVPGPSVAHLSTAEVLPIRQAPAA